MIFPGKRLTLMSHWDPDQIDTCYTVGSENEDEGRKLNIQLNEYYANHNTYVNDNTAKRVTHDTKRDQ